MKIHRIPHIVTSLFPGIIWNNPCPNSPCVHITFDDGPHPFFTNQILEILERQNVGATFFILGQKAQQYPSIVRSTFEGGHTIGLHSFEHRRLFFQSKKYFFEQIEANKTVVENIIEQPAKFFRPPYGIFRPGLIRVCRSLILEMVQWSVFTYDYNRQISDSKILNLMESDVRDGDIIVFHDGHANSHRTVNILNDVISILKEKSLKIVPM